MPQEPDGGPEQPNSREPNPHPTPQQPTPQHTTSEHPASQQPTSQDSPNPEHSPTPEQPERSGSAGPVQEPEEAVQPRTPEQAKPSRQPSSSGQPSSSPRASTSGQPSSSGGTSIEPGTGPADEAGDAPSYGAYASDEPGGDAGSPDLSNPDLSNPDLDNAGPNGPDRTNPDQESLAQEDPVQTGIPPGSADREGVDHHGTGEDSTGQNSTGHSTGQQDEDRSLALTGISKSFPGVRALHQVDFDVRPGEVHVLLGENGAGKSTLIRVLAGVHRPDAGMVSVVGQAVRMRGPQHAEQLGIATVHQETSLVPQLTVAENIHLGRPPRRFGVLSRRRMLRGATELVQRLGLDLDPRARVADLGVADRQQVEIAKALRAEARFLVLDEPTAVLGPAGVERLFAVVAELTARGVGVVFISHLLDEVVRVGDRATVLRDGAKVAEVPASTGTGELARLVVGRPLGRQHPRRAPDLGDVRLDVRGLTRRGAFEDVSFTARAGEVVGLGGMVGAGRTELVRAVFGADRYDYGEVRVGDRRVRRGSVAAARRAGMALVPEDRAGQALLPDASVEENLGLATLPRNSRLGLVALGAQRAGAERTVRELAIRASHPSQPVSVLSGGNQQKVVLGRWLLAQPEVLILDEPTRGVDVGARTEIYDLVNDLTARGTTVLVVSSDLPELLGLSDRVLVLADGRLRGELPRAEATQQRVLELAAGGPGGSRNG